MKASNTLKSKKQAELKLFFDDLTPSDRVAVVFHRDSDGLGSGAAVFAFLKTKGIKPAYHCGVEYHDFKHLEERLKAKKIEKIIFTDLGIDSQPHLIKELEQFAKILVIDHHKLYADLSSDKTTFLKAQMFSDIDGSKYPASKLVFDLLSEHADIKDIAWITCIGIHGDMGFKQWKSFVEKQFKNFKFDYKQMDLMVQSVDSYSIFHPENFNILFNFLILCKTPKEYLDSKFIKYIDKLNALIKKHIKEFEKNKEVYEEEQLLFCVLKSNYYIKSPLANEISVREPHKTLVLALDSGKQTLAFSARRQDFEVPMNELLEKSVKGLPKGSAGGHIPAAAGRIRRQDLQKFKKNLLKFQKAFLKKTK